MSDTYVGGYACKLVKTPPRELQTECSICLQLLRDPEMVNCCGYKFCKSCILPVLSRRKPCPLCGQSNISTMADRQLQRTLNGLQVYCSHAEDGCEWVGKLGSVAGHLNREYTPEDWLKGCDYVNVECLECGKVCLRKDGQGHVQEECPEAQVPCKFNHIGCQEVLLRKNMPTHLQNEKSSHMTLLLDHTQKLAEQYNTKSNEILNVIDNLQGNEDNTELSKEVARARKKLARVKVRPRPVFHSAVWGLGGFLAATFLAVLLAINVTENPLHGKKDGATHPGDIANFKRDLQDLEQRLDSLNQRTLPGKTTGDGEEIARLRAELETMIEETRVEKSMQQELRDELMEKITDGTRVHDDMLRLQADMEKIAQEHKDQTNTRSIPQGKSQDYSTEIDNLRTRLADLAGVLEDLAKLKSEMSSLSSKGDVEALKLETRGIREDLHATKQRIEVLPGLPSLLLELQRLVREELDKIPPPVHPPVHPPHGRHGRDKLKRHHGCHGHH